MSQFPELVDGKPPVISLREYDDAPWMSETCIDHQRGVYVVVEFNKPEHTVAFIDSKDNEKLDLIFRSAKANMPTN